MTDHIQTFDREHVWHPYTSMTHPLKTYPVASARGVRLKLMNGTTLIDGMSSWWAAIHGYNHPVLNTAVENQLHQMAHVMFGGLTHQPAVDLCRLLVDMTPQPLDRVFLCDSGSVSVEVAIKMAFQYWQARGKPEKTALITVRSGYHGDTFFAMSVCDPVTGMHHTFNDILPRHHFADKPGCRFDEPWDDRHFDAMRKVIKAHHQCSAAVIIEPIVQGAGGMRFYNPQYLRELKKKCQENDLLLIFDEIATGFGRTGEMFACDHSQVSPDLMCLGKAITGGYMTLATTLTTRHIAEVISDGPCGAFMHGPTFMGNPLACATAVSSINLLVSGDWQSNIRRIEGRLKNGLDPCRSLPQVNDVRTLGAIGVVEMKQEVDMQSIQQEFLDQGVWIRPFGKLIYTMPPFITEDDDLDRITRAICRVVSKQGVSP